MGLFAAACLALSVWWWLGSRVSERISILRTNSEPIRDCEETSQLALGVEHHRLLSQAPLIADLLSAAVNSGASIVEAISVVGDSMEEPSRSRLANLRASIDLGASMEEAWSTLLGDDDHALAPIATAAMRSLQTGAPLAYVLDAAATDMRQAHRAQVTEAARSAGVRTVAPLALCFLPAYLLVGVVPIIAGFASALFA